jgi:hypothetical protein
MIFSNDLASVISIISISIVVNSCLPYYIIRLSSSTSYKEHTPFRAELYVNRFRRIAYALKTKGADPISLQMSSLAIGL